MEGENDGCCDTRERSKGRRSGVRLEGESDDDDRRPIDHTAGAMEKAVNGVGVLSCDGRQISGVSGGK